MGAAGTLQDSNDERTSQCGAERRIRRQSDSGPGGGEGHGAFNVRSARPDGGSVAAHERSRLANRNPNPILRFGAASPAGPVAACRLSPVSNHQCAPSLQSLDKKARPHTNTVCQDPFRRVLQVGHTEIETLLSLKSITWKKLTGPSTRPRSILRPQ